MFGKPVGLWGPLVCICTAHICLTAIHWPRHLTGSVVSECFLFGSILFYYYSGYDLISNLNWAIRTTYLSVFSVSSHIRVWIPLCFITLFYLADLFEISVCLKSFLLWPLVSTEKVWSSPLAPSWYRDSPFCITFYFIISRIVIFFRRYGN
jgi:hypothetical protein